MNLCNPMPPRGIPPLLGASLEGLFFPEFMEVRGVAANSGIHRRAQSVLRGPPGRGKFTTFLRALFNCQRTDKNRTKPCSSCAPSLYFIRLMAQKWTFGT
jgi:hypothetical protein